MLLIGRVLWQVDCAEISRLDFIFVLRQVVMRKSWDSANQHYHYNDYMYHGFASENRSLENLPCHILH